MRKYFIVVVFAMMICFVVVSPSVTSNAAVGLNIGNVIRDNGNNSYSVYELWILNPVEINYIGYTTSGGTRWFNVNGSSSNAIMMLDSNGNYINDLSSGRSFWAYIPGNYSDFISTANGNQCRFYSNRDNFINAIPEEFRPTEPTLAEQRWDAFYEWYKNKFGYYPTEGSLIDILRNLALGDEDANTEIIFPTLTPAPSPTPTPTPIPVQTIFVPDGTGNTTIIYQYTDPTTGVITQSPYNPNVQNNIEINCDCDDDGFGNNIFGNDPTDPYSLTSSMLWADGFGVEITDNPLTAANDSQKSLAEAASEYSDSVNVVSNSFNVLPFKWLVLVGLLGGILIIAGLIRTFLGG